MEGGGEGRGGERRGGGGGVGEVEGSFVFLPFFASMFTPANLAFKIKKENISFEFSWLFGLCYRFLSIK